MNLSFLDISNTKDLDSVKEIIHKDVNESLKNYLHSKRIDQYVGFFQGKVVRNNDPDKMGRCKVRIYGIFEDSIPDDDLPWAIPDMDFIGSTVGSFIVPPVGAIVNCYFDRGDLYLPHYTTKVVVKNKMPNKANYKEDYPDTMVFFETDNGDYFKINRKKKETTFRHSTGTEIRLSGKKRVIINHTSGTKIEIFSNGDIKIDANGKNFSVTGAKICDLGGTEKTNLGGNFPVLYCTTPGVMPSVGADGKTIVGLGVSTKVTVG